MVAIGICASCQLHQHCHGKGDIKTKYGIVGGFRCTCPCRDDKSAPPKRPLDQPGPIK